MLTLKANNYVGAIMMHYYTKVIRNNGIADVDQVIADCYHILFLNYFQDTYIFDAMESIKKHKNLYRQTLKQQINDVQKWIRAYDAKVGRTMGADYNEKFSNMNFCLEDAYEHELKRLEEATVNALEKRGCEYPEICAKIDVCIMLNEFCIKNLEAKVNANRANNPKFKNCDWTSQAPLKPLIDKIASHFVYPDVSKDLIVRDRFIKFQKKWCDAEFIADNIGNPVFSDSNESMELSQVIKDANRKKVV